MRCALWAISPRRAKRDNPWPRRPDAATVPRRPRGRGRNRHGAGVREQGAVGQGRREHWGWRVEL